MSREHRHHRERLAALLARTLMAGALAALTLAAGCKCLGVVCDACPPPVLMEVTDAATGAPVEGVAVDGETAACGENWDRASTLCYGGLGVGSYTFTITAPGYLDQQVEATVGPWEGKRVCCSCSYTTVTIAVALSPA